MSTITTFTGKHFDPVNPDINEIDIKDIAHALSLICRGNGHTVHFFSVAQHCINCANEALARNYSDYVVLACLLHDASECYMSDVPRPFKNVLKDYITIENNLINMIYLCFLGRTPDKDETILIKQIDDDMLYYDLRDLLNETQSSSRPEMKSVFSNDFEDFNSVEQKYLDIFNNIKSKSNSF